MLKKIESGRRFAREAYWSIVGISCALLLTARPVMAETIWDRFSTIMKDIYGQLVAISIRRPGNVQQDRKNRLCVFHQ